MDFRWERIPQPRGHRREGPVSCSFLLGLSQRKAPQPSLVAKSTNRALPY